MSDSTAIPIMVSPKIKALDKSQTTMTVAHTKDFDIEEYFSGPMDPNTHSPLPYFLRLRGSVLPKMIIPILFIAGWATLITCITKFVWPLGINSVLLIAIGFVVAMALTFRSSTAYERYIDGIKYWQQLIMSSRMFARVIWIHAKEREGELGKEDLLAKLTCINMTIGFAVAMKYRLRRQLGYDYPDLMPYIQNLSTFAKAAYFVDGTLPEKPWGRLRRVAVDLGVPGARPDPCKRIRRGPKYHGNLPFEILAYLSGYAEIVISSGGMPSPALQIQVMNALANFTDCLSGMERVLGTPIPLAYRIALSQITWLYILALPFQLVTYLGWVAIPATVAAAYIILAILLIGRELENPFGDDITDIDMDGYIRQLKVELDILTSKPPPKSEDFIATDENFPLGPKSTLPYSAVKEMSVEEIREYLEHKVGMGKPIIAKNQVAESKSGPSNVVEMV